MGSLSNEINRLKQIKGKLDWNDQVGTSFDIMLEKLEYDAQKMDNAISELDNKLREITIRTPLAEIEEAYSALTRMLMEAEV